MPVTDVRQDLDNLTLTITADFAAPVERIWQVYADPRQLEKVWGPPTYPATVVDHDLTPGGRMTYFMTGPEGDKFAGYWEITTVDEPHELLLRRRLRRPGLQPEPGPAGLHERLHLRRARRRHPRDLREHLRVRRGAAEGAGHGHRRGRHVGDQPDRRPDRLLRVGVVNPIGAPARRRVHHTAQLSRRPPAVVCGPVDRRGRGRPASAPRAGTPPTPAARSPRPRSAA